MPPYRSGFPMRSLVRLLAAALALAALVAPGAADAAPRHRSHHAAGPSYPMKAEEFRALMEKRIDGVRNTIDKKLDRRGVSAERKKAIHKIFDESSKDLRAEIARATADGTVTEGEAGKVKALVVGLRSKVRERLRAEKDPHAKAKLAKEEAAKKDKEKPKAKEKAAPAGHDAPGKGSHDHENVVKTAGAGSPAAAAHKKSGVTKVTKAKAPAKGAGATKPAKASPGKKPKPASPAAGEDL